MKVCRIWICFFFLSLQDGNTGLTNVKIHKGTEGGNITVGCSFTFSGGTRMFCKEECEEKDILVKTTGERAQTGRYSIEYKEVVRFFIVSSALLYVCITNLTKSDSGRYRCYLDRSFRLDSYEEFEIRVEDAPVTFKPNWTLPPFPTSLPSASTLTTTQSLGSTPSPASPEATRQSQQQQTTPAAGAAGVLLYLGLIVLVVIIVLSAAVLILCRNRASKPTEPPVGPEYAEVTEANGVYEEVREEDRQSRSPPVDISTVYTYAKYTKSNGVETTDDYSFVTAATPQNQVFAPWERYTATEDDSSKLTYSQVDYSNGKASLLSSDPCGDADKVIYSVPGVETSLDSSHAEDTSATLYSTVTLHQR